MAGRRVESGFTIVEVLVAMMLIASAALGVATLLGAAVQARAAARLQTMATLLASQKMEQLLSLTWRFDPAGTGLPESDTSTDLSYDPPQGGGAGLAPSPAGTLDADTAGYVDYLDGVGRWLGRGAMVPAGAVYVRRWGIDAPASDPADSRVVKVRVRPASPSAAFGSGDVRITAWRTRKAS